MKTGDSQLLFAGMQRLSEDNLVNIKNRSHSVTAEIVVPDTGVSRVIMNQGGVTGGWALYVKDNRLRYAYNFVGIDEYRVTAEAALSSGEHQVRMEFAYDGAAASVRPATSPSTSTAIRSEPDASNVPKRCSSTSTKQTTSAATAALP